MNKKILIIEDEEDIQKILKVNLELAGYDVFLASAGQQGIEMSLKENPELVILDVMLPDASGFDICQEIKKSNDLIKIILYTGKLEAVDARRAREAGADDFTVKTVDFKYLLESIKKLIS